MQHWFDNIAWGAPDWIISSILLKYEQPLNYQSTEGTPPYNEYNPQPFWCVLYNQTDKSENYVDTVNNLMHLII